MKAILGKKIGMTRVFDQQGQVQDVTVIQAGPCVVTQIKKNEIDGYQAVQIGFGISKDKGIKKPQLGHLKKSQSAVKFLREIKLDYPQKNAASEDKNPGMNLGDKITVGIFKIGDKVVVSGISKGKGFAGTIKRHGFSRGPVTHGSHNIRQPGSIGSSSFPSRVYKGKRMSGHMGVEKISVKNLPVVEIDLQQNLLLLKGATPGAKNSLLMIRTDSKQK